MKPILFNTEMVRAILDGRKTVTRRVVKPQPKGLLVPELPGTCWPGYFGEEGTQRVVRPPYFVGDILYVRETWGDYSECQPGGAGYYLYRADYPDGAKTDTSWDGVKYDLPLWRPSIHMPKQAARLFLRVTDVRVERLQDIAITGLQEEGVLPDGYLSQFSVCTTDAFKKFQTLWGSTIKPADRALYGWAANPWVWAIEFERIAKEEAEHG